MTDDKKCCGGSNSEKSSGCCDKTGKKKSCCKSIVLLVVLVAVAAGVFAYVKSNKTKDKPSADIEKSDAATKINDNPVLAIIDGDKIKRQEVVEIVNSMPAQMKQIPMDQLFAMALEQLISNKIIDKEAAKSGLEKDEDVLAKLELAKEQFIRAKFLENIIKEKITEESLKIKYDEYVKSFPKVEEVKAAHILVDDENLAKSIIKKLNKGATFADLAKENSKDGTSENGGDLGYFTKTDVVPEFGEAAFATKIGEYTKSPVKTNFGYHIIMIEEKRVRPPAEFAQIKPYMEQEMQRSVLDEVIKEMKEKANIELFDINGNPLPADVTLEQPVSDAEDTDAEDSDAEDSDESDKAE